MENLKPSIFILPIIVVAQFLCTSLWFAGNAVIPDLIKNIDLDSSFIANLTSAVQFGFISGTFVFALFTIADRFSPSLVFFCCAIVAALSNLGITIEGISFVPLLAFRFFTGFFLAGIYPVGMKIAADYFQKGLGRSLGFLVGALVLGTAFPHFLKSITQALPWKYVIYSISLLSVLGGVLLILFVPDGPFRKKSQRLDLTAFLSGFKKVHFRSAAFGYFGHMWELYSFWAFVPVIITMYKNKTGFVAINVSFLSFLVIASGGIACVVSGILSQYFGAKRVATLLLTASCCCCLLSPFFLMQNSYAVFLSFLFFWGMVVVGDSPLFSTLVAQNAPNESKGTLLTIVNCIGFSITIISIQTANFFSSLIEARYLYMILAIGPILGIWALTSKRGFKPPSNT